MVPQLPRVGVSRLVVLAVALAALAVGTAGADVNRIVLRVNDEIVTLWEFQERRRARIQEIQRADLPQERRQRLLADVGSLVMREMYEELLVLSRADQLDVRITDREVEAAVAQAKAQYGIESDEDFRAALAASGMSIEDLTQQMRRNLEIREVMGREVQQKIELEEEDLRRYYRDHPDEFSRPRRLQVREVVIPDEAAAGDEARDALAAEVREALLAGEEGRQRLDELADAGQATGLLELGWIERGDLEPALERGIWDLEPGAVSPPIVARGGRHVVEVLDEEEARLLPFGDVQDQIRNKLRAGRYEEELSKYLAELEEKAYVVQNLPPEAAGFQAAGAGGARDELSGFGLAPAAPGDEPAEPAESGSQEAPEPGSEEASESDSEPESTAPEPPQ